MRVVTRLGLATAAAWSLAIAQQSSPQALAAPSADAPHAPERLSETGLYDADRPGSVNARNRPFSPQYPLWSDGASKLRWVYLPPGTTIDASSESDWTFPVGTRFWKEFQFGGRKVETRMLWKASVAEWVAVSYAWNVEGTDAVLVPPEGLTGVVELAPGRRHSIPSRNDCLACHGAKPTTALGFNRLQLSTDRDPNAIHGEPLA
ncbi:MAG: hypothetical protein L0271_18270, partial [Gemmatimonadetes bacterium]|nr:hypothetical protein [Gemmatimonadota bacterium]